MPENELNENVILENILRSSTDMAIAATDLDFRILYYNQVAENLFGYRAEEIIGKTVMEVHTKEKVDPSRFERAIEIVRKEGKYRYILEQKKEDGIRFIESTVSGIWDRQNNLIGFVLMSQDITGRKKAEDELQKSRERYRRITGAITGYIYTVRLESGTPVETIHSEACFAVTGYTCREFAAAPYLWIRMVLEEDHDIVGDQIEQVISGHFPPPIEHRIVRKDGAVRWVESVMVPNNDINGNLISYDGIVRDITERKKAEAQVARKNKVLDAINKVFRDVLTCETEEELGKTCLTVAEELTGSKFGYFGELNKDGLFDVIAVSNPGWDICNIPEGQASLALRNMPVRGIDRATMRDGKPRIVNGEEAIATHPDHVNAPSGHPGLTAFLGVPLKHEGKTIGMIALGNKEGGYTLEDRENIEAFSVALVEALKGKRAEEELRKAKDRLSKAQEVAHMGNWDWDIVNNTLLWSDEIYRIFGLKPREFGLTYEAFLNLVHPYDREFVRQSVNEALYGNKPYSIDHCIMLPDGSRRTVHEQAEVFFDANGKPIRMVGTVQDITDRKRADEALRLSEEKFSKAFRSSPTFITICTLNDDRFIDVNDAFLNASGYSREEVIGRSSEELGIWVDPADREKMAGRLREEGIVNNQEIKFRVKSGNVLTALWSAELIDIEGEPCVLAVILDITERKKLESQLLHSQKMEAVGQLAGGVAHDFNNILSAIMSYGYLLRNKLRDDEQSRDNIDKILLLSDRAAHIIQGLLAFSRKQHFEFVPVKLNNTIRNIEKLLAKFIGEDVGLRTRLTNKEPAIIADKTQIEQIIMNLATNARDAMPEGGSFTIETEVVEIDENFIKTHGYGEPGIYALLSVTDKGTGMDEETKQKIFEPFFTTKEVGKGTGLGLSIIYGIVKQHNGYINVYSEPGKGATFRIYFPIIKAAAEKEKAKDLPDLSGKAEAILLAEDEPAVRDSIRKILEEFGYKVIDAEDGEDAVEKFAEHKDEIELLILDVVMPRKNGKETFEEIRKLKPGIKVLFTSGYTADIIQRRKILKEDVIFISKPILPNKFLAKIREVLEDERND